MQSLTDILRQQKKRFRTLLGAFQPANVEQRFRVVQGVCTRLPLPLPARQRLLSWGLHRFVGRSRSVLSLDVQPSQKVWESRGRERLRRLLQGNEHLAWPVVENPAVSFIVVLHNSAHLSLLSLGSILHNAGVSHELIVVDNASSDETEKMLARLQGAKILRNQTNVGFGPACMQAAACAVANHLCFFNNDALLSPGAMPAAIAVFANPRVGAVGGKVLLANGVLQEAGDIVWSDGSSLGYGRGQDPLAPEYNFRRPVDFCSGVFLITPRQLFAELGGFSSDFAPAYYEDTDYCMTLWHKGYQVLYEPLAVIQHYESATSGGNEFATARMVEHQKKFLRKWKTALQRHYPPDRSNIHAARIAVNSAGLRILYIDDRVPHRTLGAGFPRSNDILSQLVALGHHITCASFTSPLLGDEYSDIPRNVELLDGLCDRKKLLQDYLRHSDIVWVSRPHNLHVLLTQCMTGETSRPFRLVYDAEAIFADRRQQQSELAEVAAPATVPYDEFALAKSADIVVVVSEQDRQAMLQAGVKAVSVIGHRLSLTPTPATFTGRSTFLFVGGVHGSDNPNADSIRYFCRSIWPGLQKATAATFIVAGYGTAEVLGDLSSPSVQVLGAQEDLRPFYEAARVFVVPTRYAAGLPFKAHEAAAFGVPLVVSGVIARQLEWQDGTDYLVGRDAEGFAEQCIRLYRDQALWETIRTGALQRVREELSPDVFENSVRSVLNDVATGGHTQAGVE